MGGGSSGQRVWGDHTVYGSHDAWNGGRGRVSRHQQSMRGGTIKKLTVNKGGIKKIKESY